MYKFITGYLTILFLVLFPTSTIAQSEINKQPDWEISMCPVKLLAGSADFTATFDFVARTDATGVVIQVTPNAKKSNLRFVDTDKFPTCVKNWRLSPSEDHYIRFGVGTIFFDRKPNYILISNKSRSLKFTLPSEIFEWSANEK